MGKICCRIQCIMFLRVRFDEVVLDSVFQFLPRQMLEVHSKLLCHIVPVSDAFFGDTI